MRNRLFIFLFATMLMFGFSAGPLSGEVIWEDGFESGNLSGWTSAGSNWAIVTSSAAKTGSRYLKIEGPTTSGENILRLDLSTVGMSSIRVDYYFNIKAGLESGDEVKIEWTNDDVVWQEIFTYTLLPTNDIWIFAEHNLPIFAEDKANFGLRLVANLGSSADRVHFDDFQITAIPEPATFTCLVLFAGTLFFLRRRLEKGMRI